MSQQFSHSAIVMTLAEQVAKRLTRQVIAQLQRLKDLQSGDDSRLRNVWEEICVQVQHEQSYAWDAYDDTVRSLVDSKLDKLPLHERGALWLQTQEASYWEDEDEEERDPYPVDADNTIDYLMEEYIYSEAGQWSNSRIQAFLNKGPEFDF
jgi:hypothetical protein